MTRFLCTGDLHLGAGSDYGREPGDRLKDQRTTLGVIVELAREHDVDAILFAGDLFDGPTVTPEQYAAVQQPLRELDIPFIAITGNGKHDCAMRDVKAPEVLSDVAEVFTEPSIRIVGDTAVCMLPWVAVSRRVALQDGGDRDDIHQAAAGLLIRTARGMHDGITMHADIAPIRHRVLMLHWSIEGASLPNGLAIDEHAHEPILPIDDLEALGYDAIVAGHIHKPQLLGSEDATGPMLYVGSPMPLNFGEGHFDHGVWILDTEGDGLGASSIEFLPIDSRPFVTLDFDHDDPVAQIALSMSLGFDVPDAVVRVRYRATEEQARRIDHSAITRALYDAGAHRVYGITADVERADRARVEGIDEELAPLAALDLWIESQEITDPGLIAGLRETTARYVEQVSS